MIRYGTLTNGNLIPAPRRIMLDGWQILNPTDEQYSAAGYLPVRYTDAPVAPDGYYPMSGWDEQDGEIVEVWAFVPNPEPAEETTPAWDVEQGEFIPAGRIITVHGVMYECIKNHYAAWSKQPPNDEYWKEV